MRPDLDSLLAKARGQQAPATQLDDAFNRHVWRRIRMSGGSQGWSLALLLASPAFGLCCLLLAVSVGAAFGLHEAKRQPHFHVAHTDLSVFSAEPPQLPSILLHRP